MSYYSNPEYATSVLTNEDKTEKQMLMVTITLAEYRQLCSENGKYELMVNNANAEAKAYKQKCYDMLVSMKDRTFEQERDLDTLIRDWQVKKRA